MKRRGSGILCHITSLPSAYGIGDLGPGAYAFVDFLAGAKQSYWQILPLNPTNERYLFSPYSSMSSCAGNTLLLSPDLLANVGLLSPADLSDRPTFAEDRLDYDQASQYKRHLLRRAFGRFKERASTDHDFQRFCQSEPWLQEHAVFTALSEEVGRRPLTEWPAELKDKKSLESRELPGALADAVEQEKFLQYLFYRQWRALKSYCNSRGVLVIGDFPLFMNYDSADIWAHPELFKVDQDKRPHVVA